MRKYQVSDSKFLEHADVVNDHLKTDLPDFTKFDSDLDETKRTSLEAYIGEAKEVSSDRVVQGVLKNQTQSLESAMAEARTICGDVFYFAEKKFANNPAVMSEFGLKEFQKINKSQSGLSLFMIQLAKVIGKYRDDLLAMKATPELLDSVKPMSEKISSDNVTQENLKGNRPLSTLERKEKLNAVYDILLEFNKASKKVYAKDPIKLARYFMPTKPRSGKNDEGEKE